MILGTPRGHCYLPCYVLDTNSRTSEHQVPAKNLKFLIKDVIYVLMIFFEMVVNIITNIMSGVQYFSFHHTEYRKWKERPLHFGPCTGKTWCQDVIVSYKQGEYIIKVRIFICAFSLLFLLFLQDLVYYVWT